jgi:putative aldouronate transport system permease protein
MLAPAIVYYILFKYRPLYGLLIAFKDFQVRSGILASPWAEPFYRHFVFFIKSTYFVQLMRNTLVISFLKLFVGVPFSVILALTLNEVSRPLFKRSVQTVTYLPHFLSWVVVYGITYAMLSESMGVLNQAIKSATGSTVNFLSSLEWFRTVLIGSEVWRNMGWGAIVFLAALAGVDPSLYESAVIDGASRLQMVWHITLPAIYKVIVIILILRTGQILEAGFEHVYVFYNIRVYPVADIIDTWVYRTGLEQWNFSLAAAVGLFKSFIAMALLLTVNRIAKRVEASIW